MTDKIELSTDEIIDLIKMVNAYGEAEGYVPMDCNYDLSMKCWAINGREDEAVIDIGGGVVRYPKGYFSKQ